MPKSLLVTTTFVLCSVLLTPVVQAQKMYWTDFELNTIERANLDGSGRENLITGLPSPVGIALDLSCTLDLEANYATSTLDLDFELGHTVPVFFNAGIWFQESNHSVLVYLAARRGGRYAPNCGIFLPTKLRC